MMAHQPGSVGLSPQARLRSAQTALPAFPAWSAGLSPPMRLSPLPEKTLQSRSESPARLPSAGAELMEPSLGSARPSWPDALPAHLPSVKAALGEPGLGSAGRSPVVGAQSPSPSKKATLAGLQSVQLMALQPKFAEAAVAGSQ